MSPRRSRHGTPSTALLLVANILIPVAILVFATGFFPYKPLLPGLASYNAAPEYGDPPAAPFDKLVFMVVDALRRYGCRQRAAADFSPANRSGRVEQRLRLHCRQRLRVHAIVRSMLSLCTPTNGTGPRRLTLRKQPRLIRDGAALPFTAHATSPTVTMPRLKAITTGSIPSFLDVVLNLDEGDESSSLASQDSWLAQMKAKGSGKLVMYGDDTWLKLFPGTFDRADGTTSFFVSVSTAFRGSLGRGVGRGWGGGLTAAGLHRGGQ